jgi:aconitate hydratase
MNLAQKLIAAHLVEGSLRPGTEIGIKVDQTLCQDATGTLVMLELEAMGLERVKTQVSVQYVDHNLLQDDNKNQEDHLFLLSAARRFGLWFSPPGNGVSHPVHMERFGRPGASLLGSDSHTCAAGALGMLAIGAGGLEVAMAMAGRPFYFKMPKVWGIHLHGGLPDWVSAKDVILELLRRHSVKGGVGKILEYHGEGLARLSAWDRHTIANMGAELGATASIFPADEQVLKFLQSQSRAEEYEEWLADDDASYDLEEDLDLSKLEPLAAEPTSPDKISPVRLLAGLPVVQTYIGSSANPGYRDLAIAAEIVKGRHVAQGVSFDINPASRQVLEDLVQDGHLYALLHAGARVHQTGCNGCIGMGQAPASGGISLRTVPRNFPGRSGTLDDQVYLVSPETAAASALTGKITDPRSLGSGRPYPKVSGPARPSLNPAALVQPLPLREALETKLVKGKNIDGLPSFEPLAPSLEVTLALQVGDNVSTDTILPAGTRVLPYRSNIPKISEFAFVDLDSDYHVRAKAMADQGKFHAIQGGQNYGQGSSREHAALAPRWLGLRLVLALSFARIHWQNLVNFGVLPLTLEPEEAKRLKPGDRIRINDLPGQLKQGNQVLAEDVNQSVRLICRHDLSPRQVEIMLSGGLINWIREHQPGKQPA